MKIKKTLFSTEIETTPEELENFTYKVRPSIFIGFFSWLGQTFGLDMLPNKKKEKNG